MRVRAISLAGNGSWTHILDLYVAESKRLALELSRRRSCCLIPPFCPSGYQNILFAMIFVPLAVVLLICLVVTALVVLNKKR